MYRERERERERERKKEKEKYWLLFTLIQAAFNTNCCILGFFFGEGVSSMTEELLDLSFKDQTLCLRPTSLLNSCLLVTNSCNCFIVGYL